MFYSAGAHALGSQQTGSLRQRTYFVSMLYTVSSLAMSCQVKMTSVAEYSDGTSEWWHGGIVVANEMD